MEDITPLNLEDQPKLFGLRHDQLIVVLVTLLLGTQLMNWLPQVQLGGQDLRMDACIFIMLLGPLYCLVTLNNSAGYLETVLNFFLSTHVYIPGPDPNPVRFLEDEPIVDFTE